MGRCVCMCVYVHIMCAHMTGTDLSVYLYAEVVCCACYDLFSNCYIVVFGVVFWRYFLIEGGGDEVELLITFEKTFCPWMCKTKVRSE